MKSGKRFAFIIICIPAILLFLYGVNEGVDNETIKIMPFAASNTYIYCSKCHTPAQIGNFRSPTNACDTYCQTCHKDMDRHHNVGFEIKDELPKEVSSLTKGNKLACFTCHDLKLNRYSGETYKAESLFESVFSFKSKYKTYYLVKRNNNGQLCKSCH